MNIKRIMLKVLAVVVITAAILLLTTMGTMDKIIQVGIEKYGTDITRAEVSLDQVSVDLSNGQALLRGLFVGNPEGFETEYLTSLDEISVTLDLDSITSEPIVIKEILVQSPIFIYEMGLGGNNLDAILNNVRDYINTGSADTEKEKDNNKHAGPRLIIDDIYIRDGTVSVSHKAMGGKKMVTAPLHEIHLKDIGREEGGATPGEVVEKIIGSVRSESVSAVAKLNLDKVKQAGGAIKEGLGKAGDKIKGLFQ